MEEDQILWAKVEREPEQIDGFSTPHHASLTLPGAICPRVKSDSRTPYRHRRNSLGITAYSFGILRAVSSVEHGMHFAISRFAPARYDASGGVKGLTLQRIRG